jgi:hypothetical protein
MEGKTFWMTGCHKKKYNKAFPLLGFYAVRGDSVTFSEERRL